MDSGWEITGFSDPDFAGEAQGGKSTSGLVIKNGNTVYRKPATQQTVSQSTAEAEYIALRTFARETCFLRDILNYTLKLMAIWYNATYYVVTSQLS